MSWALAMLAAAIVLQVQEWLYRTSEGSFLSVLPLALPLILMAQVCLHHGFSTAPTWLGAWVLLSIASSTVRLAGASALGEPIENWAITVGGIGIMILGGIVVKTGSGG